MKYIHTSCMNKQIPSFPIFCKNESFIPHVHVLKT